MGISQHLATGEKLAGHYEVLQVLGEDEFEILYLVKDLHMGDAKFVLKELFLKAYASRIDGNHVEVGAKAKQSFEQTKQDIREEIEKHKRNKLDSPKYYGYFEENNTLYTIMEFVNSSDISPYLTPSSKTTQTDIVSQEELVEPKVTESKAKKKKEKPKSKFFLNTLIISLLIFLGLLYYSYNMIQEDKLKAKNRTAEPVSQVEPTVMKHPPLEDKTQKEEAKEKKPEENLSVKVPEVSEDTILEGASYIDEENMTEPIEAQEVQEENITNTTPQDLSHLPIAETFPMEETSTPTPKVPEVVSPPVIPEPQIIETPLPREQSSNSALGTRIN
jgi:cytoskeletal protein RodZ